MANDSDTRFDDILDRLDRAWGRWLDALGRIDESDTGGAALAAELMVETATDDERAVERIRDLVEGNTYQQLPGPDSVDDADSLADARRIMEHHHARLTGALDTVAETAEDVVSAVEAGIGPLTWERYPDRAERLTTTGDASN